jgi:hypothetical protein
MNSVWYALIIEALSLALFVSSCLIGDEPVAKPTPDLQASPDRSPGELSRSGSVSRSKNIVALLQNELVQSSLNLDAEQIAQIRTLTLRLLKDVEGQKAELADTPTKFAEAFQKLQWTYQCEIEDHLLTKHQVRRLRQIQLQLSGFVAFYDSEVEEELELTEKDKAQRKAFWLALSREGKKLIGKKNAGALPQAELARILESNDRKAAADFIATLTKRQQQKWSELAGKKVGFSNYDLLWSIRLKDYSEAETFNGK